MGPNQAIGKVQEQGTTNLGIRLNIPANKKQQVVEYLEELLAYPEEKREARERAVEGKESKETLEKNIKKYIITANKKIVDEYALNGKVQVDGGKINIKNTAAPLLYIAENDIRIEKTENREITIDGKKDNIFLLHLLVAGEKMTAIQIPEAIKNKSLESLEMGKRLLAHKDNDWFPNIDFTKKADKNWIVWSTENSKKADGSLYTDISTKDKDATTDVVRECLQKGMKPISIVDTLLLGEIIKQGLGDEYIDFQGQKADSDEANYTDIREKIKKIEEYTGIQFNEYDTSTSTEYIIRNLGIYKDKKGNERAFLRGVFDSGGGAIGGVCSLGVGWVLGRTASYFGFRACL